MTSRVAVRTCLAGHLKLTEVPTSPENSPTPRMDSAALLPLLLLLCARALLQGEPRSGASPGRKAHGPILGCVPRHMEFFLLLFLSSLFPRLYRLSFVLWAKFHLKGNTFLQVLMMVMTIAVIPRSTRDISVQVKRSNLLKE